LDYYSNLQNNKSVTYISLLILLKTTEANHQVIV